MGSLYNKFPLFINLASKMFVGHAGGSGVPFPLPFSAWASAMSTRGWQTLLKRLKLKCVSEEVPSQPTFGFPSTLFSPPFHGHGPWLFFVDATFSLLVTRPLSSSLSDSPVISVLLKARQEFHDRPASAVSKKRGSTFPSLT